MELTHSPTPFEFGVNSQGLLIAVLPAHKNTKFQNLKIDVQVLNTIAIASGYGGRDPQEGTSVEALFSKFSFKLQSMVKDLLLVL